MEFYLPMTHYQNMQICKVHISFIFNVQYKDISKSNYDINDIHLQFKTKFRFSCFFSLETGSCCQRQFDLCEVWNNRTFFLFHFRSKDPIKKFAYQKCFCLTHTCDKQGWSAFRCFSKSFNGLYHYNV